MPSFDVEVVRTAMGFATIHVANARNLAHAQQLAVEKANDMEISTKESFIEPVDGWVPADLDNPIHKDVFFLMPTFIDETANGDEPLAFLIKIPVSEFMYFQNRNKPLLPEQWRALKQIGLRADGTLNDVPGFFDADKDTYISGIDLVLSKTTDTTGIYSSNNNERSIFGDCITITDDDTCMHFITDEYFNKSESSYSFAYKAHRGRYVEDICSSYINEGSIFIDMAKEKMPLLIDSSYLPAIKEYVNHGLSSTQAASVLMNEFTMATMKANQSLQEWIGATLAKDFTDVVMGLKESDRVVFPGAFKKAMNMVENTSSDDIESPAP